MNSTDLRNTSPLAFRRVVIIGGGCYGSWYTRQLMRAQRAAAVSIDEVVVVDRDPSCQVAGLLVQDAFEALPVRLAVSTWDDYLDEWLAVGTAVLTDDAMVPSPLMPHICLDWMMRRARQRWPGRGMQVTPLDFDPGTPWQRAAADGRHYVSYATWTCPTNCIEPARCPAIRAPRDWSMPVTIARIPTREHPQSLEAAPSLRGTVIFPCVHRAFGVGMIDARTIAEADERLAAWGREGPCQVLVGTMSHCHGALGVLALA